MLEVVELEFLKNSSIRYGFFTNRGGASKGIYSSLNAGLGSLDDKSSVLENRRRARAHLSKGEPPLCTLYQCHSNRVVEVREPWPATNRIEADAMVTRKTNLLLGVLTADCVPVLLADPEAGIIAAAHAGWKGALDGIIENTVLEMEALGAQRSAIQAATGPSIQQTSYEVGPELRRTFLDRSAAHKEFFLPGGGDRFQLDLVGFVQSRLFAEGVEKVRISTLDTYSDASRFFSFRRATHRNEPDYGRQLSAICLIGQNR